MTSAILKADVVCDFVMTSTPNVLTTELHDLLYNQYNDNMCSYSFFIYPTHRTRVCKIRFVSMGENCGKPFQLCKHGVSSQLTSITVISNMKEPYFIIAARIKYWSLSKIFGTST